MSQLILSRGIEYRRSIIKRLFPKLELGPSFLIASLLIFVALITVITLMFSTRQVTKGYVLNSLEAKHQDVVKESEKMDMQISTVRSLNYIQDSSKVKSMIKPAQIVFASGDIAIAKK